MTEQKSAKSEQRRAAGVSYGAHALHDGYTDLVYVMLPVWQAEFGLGFAALGALRTVFSGTMAAFQVPASMLAERYGAPIVLTLGTALAGLGYCLAGVSSGVAILVAGLFISGLGASTQHPLGSSLITRAFPGKQSMKAIGTYNFAGDIGKMSVPAAGAFLLAVMPWRETVLALGSIGLIAAVAIFIFIPRLPAVPVQDNKVKRARGGTSSYGFPLLLSIGVLDSATRMAFLTFLPFVLTAKGASLQTIGIALTLVFAGGAVGKLVCAFIGARIGAVATVWLTEIVTAAAILALLPLPLDAAMFFLPVIGVALNGTSSVLYGSVPDLVPASRHARAFGIFYTGTIGAGAISPALYGLLGDLVGVQAVMIVIACAVLLTLPLTIFLRPALAEARIS